MTAQHHTGSRRASGLWQSHLSAVDLGTMPAPAAPATDTGRQLAKMAVAAARASCAPARTAATDPAREKLAGLTCWRETSPEHRRVLVMLANLPRETTDKSDRDLTESEKVLLRAAARRLAEGISGLAASL